LSLFRCREKTLTTETGALNRDALRPALLKQVKAALLNFQSSSYTAGYKSRIERQQNILDRL
jgi:hypothetical protein